MKEETIKNLLEQIQAFNKARDSKTASIKGEELLIEMEQSELSSAIESNSLQKLTCSLCLELVEAAILNHTIDSAEKYALKALKIAEALQDKDKLLAKSYFELGKVNAKKLAWDIALDYFHKVIQILENKEDKDLLALTYHHIGEIYSNLSDYAHALHYLSKALLINEEEGNNRGKANCLANMGTTYMVLCDYPLALQKFNQALSINETLGNKLGIAACLINIGVIYTNLSDFTQALKNFDKAFRFATEVDYKMGMANSLEKIGITYKKLKNFEQALAYFQQSLSIFEIIGDKKGIASNLMHIGNVYTHLFDYPQALNYIQKSLAINEMVGNKLGIAQGLKSIGNLYAVKNFAGHSVEQAESNLLHAIEISISIGEKKNLFECYLSLATLYESIHNLEGFRIYFKKYHYLEKEVLSEEARKESILFEQRKQAAEREKEIEIAKATSNAKLKATSMLLHRVLPESIANRMIEGEENISDYFSSASILFADIEGFTSISAHMKAIDVVKFLNYVFGNFDAIMQKLGCEKIKTIGDGYMAVAGVPIPCEDHAERLAAAALEMQDTIDLPDEIRNTLPIGSKFGIRIGLHIGPVVAGVIGKERFVYDIHSDAVNIASRMESTGQVGKVHISEDFADHLQNRMKQNPTVQFNIQPRGEMEVKGKGKMMTYFLSLN